jgi:hypothetical protein
MKRLKRLKDNIFNDFQFICRHCIAREDYFPCQKPKYNNNCSLCEDCYIKSDFKRKLDAEFQGYLIDIDEEAENKIYKNLKVQYPETIDDNSTLDTKHSVEAIELGLSYHFKPRQNINIPNLSWGLLNHEADFVSITKTGYLTEVEIKRSWSDFLADFKKRIYHKDERVSKFYYCVPASIKDKVTEYLKTNKIWTDGVFYFSETTFADDKAVMIQGPIIYDNADFSKPVGTHRALTAEEMIHVGHLGCMRIWNLIGKLIQNNTRLNSFDVLENKLKNLLIENDRKEK